MNFSELGERLAGGSGIETLMDDLGHALASSGPNVHMLGGGNPAHIPAVEAVWTRRMQEITNEPAKLRRTLAIYDPPRGNAICMDSLAEVLRKELGWPVGPENIAVTPGGQTAFFFLFNLFGGSSTDGRPARILFPLMPEYIGYANQALTPGTLIGHRPRIEEIGDHRFRYHIDFESLEPDPRVHAMCVSRPTNPSGNVVSDAEMSHLADLAEKRGIPLIIDNAYGWPFPGIVFDRATPPWNSQTIHVMSLSKVGLPGTRTAFVIAPPKIAAAVSSMMAVTGLANGNFGQAITEPLLRDGTLLSLSRDVIRPYYLKKRDLALAAVEEFFPADIPYRLHECGGAMFLWLWLPGSRRTSHQLYAALKKRGVLVVPGDYFFFGLPPGWSHAHECLRISFAMEEDQVREGLRVIASEISG